MKTDAIAKWFELVAAITKPQLRDMNNLIAKISQLNNCSRAEAIEIIFNDEAQVKMCAHCRYRLHYRLKPSYIAQSTGKDGVNCRCDECGMTRVIIPNECWEQISKVSK